MSKKRIEKIDYYTKEFKCGFCGKWNDLGDDCPCTIKREEKEDGRNDLGRVSGK
jgi:hypothetical protein